MRIVSLAGGLAAAAVLLASSSAFAADTFYPTAVTPFQLATSTYTQNFDTLAATGTSSVLPSGWQVFEGGSNGDGVYAAGTGSSTAGNVYSFGAAGSSDRALGSLASGSLTPIYYGAFFANALGSAITGLGFSYTGEQWRAGDTTADMLTFQYSLDATNVRDGTWTTLSSLNFASPNATADGAIIGNLAANQTALSGALANLSIASGATFAIRWMDVNSEGADDGLAVDNFALTATTGATAVPEPASWAMMIAGVGLVGCALRRRRSSTTLAVA